MAKNEKTATPHITWHLTNDGLEPTRAPHGYVVRNPFSRVVPPGGAIEINLCVAADYPMFAWPARSHKDDVTVPLILQPGADLTVTVRNESKYSTMIVEDKEVLVNLTPIVDFGTTAAAE